MRSDRRSPIYRDRAHQRYEVGLDCKVHIRTTELAAIVADLSLGGLRIEFFFPMRDLRIGDVEAVTISGIGRFDVACRWSSLVSLGVVFTSKDQARRRIGQYLEDQGLV